MRYDMDEFHEVAAVVVKYNKHLKGLSAGRLAHDMVALAHSMDKPGYTATAGYMLTVFNHPEGGLGCKPSISHIIF
jgi:hypothetical protein